MADEDELPPGLKAIWRSLQLGVSQEALGERAQLHRTYVGRLERGELNPSLHNVVRLAAGLGVDVTDLVRALRREDSEP